jgi:hypothetical protein
MIQRSFCEGDIYPPKTEDPEATLPLDAALAEVLCSHRARAIYQADSDFLFAGDSGKPRWPDVMLADYFPTPRVSCEGIDESAFELSQCSMLVQCP